MKIAVCGGSKPFGNERDLAGCCGEVVANMQSIEEIVWGAGTGLPYKFVQSFIAAGGPTEKLLGISPWGSKVEHEEKGFPLPGGTITYTGMGFARNSLLVESANVVVVIGGGAGTLTELGYAAAYGKVIIAHEKCRILPGFLQSMRAVGAKVNLETFSNGRELLEKLSSVATSVE